MHNDKNRRHSFNGRFKRFYVSNINEQILHRYTSPKS